MDTKLKSGQTLSKDKRRYVKTFIECKVCQLLGKCGICKDDLEDIEQELHLDLLKRLHHYNPSKAGFTTFVQRVVENKIANLLRDRCSEKGVIEHTWKSLDRRVHGSNDAPSNGTTFGNLVTAEYYDKLFRGKSRSREDERQLVADVRRIIAILPEEFRLACKYLSSGKTISETARLLGINRPTFYVKILLPFRNVFQAAELKNYVEK